MVDPVSTLAVLLAALLGGALLLWAQHCSVGCRGQSKSGARLPKGSFGWPIIGESLAYTKNPSTFASSRVKRCGKIFKSSLFFQPTIVGTTPEFAKFVLGNSGLFLSGWPASVIAILGPKAFIFHNGQSHMAIKKLSRKGLLPKALRTKVNILETIILQNLASWQQRRTVVAIDETRKITFDTGMWLLLGARDVGRTPEGRKGQENFLKLIEAVSSPPLNLPGTAFNKGLKAKGELTTYFKYLIQQRKGKENMQGDFLSDLLAAREDEKVREEVKDLDDDTIADKLLLMWFGAYDTTSTTLTWILKFMIDHPEVFHRLQAEQQEILKSKDPFSQGSRLTWEDTRKMVYAQKKPFRYTEFSLRSGRRDDSFFLQAVHRTLTIGNVFARKADQDVEYEGYLLPKGWTVAIMPMVIHSDPDIHPNPETLNPDRFDVTPKAYTYLPFSSGPHMCPGIETAKLISLIFIHHLTTTYRYESGAPDRGMEYKTTPMIVGGYPINIFKN